ncbi:MAG: hypothetical protein AAFY83_06040, partial [Pseudomonadota bacterium]
MPRHLAMAGAMGPPVLTRLMGMIVRRAKPLISGLKAATVGIDCHCVPSDAGALCAFDFRD